MNDLFGDNNNWSWCLQNLDDVIKTHGAPCRAWVTLLNVDDATNTHGAPCRAWVNLTWYARRHSQWQHLCGTVALFQDDRRRWQLAPMVTRRKTEARCLIPRSLSVGLGRNSISVTLVGEIGWRHLRRCIARLFSLEALRDCLVKSCMGPGKYDQRMSQFTWSTASASVSLLQSGKKMANSGVNSTETSSTSKGLSECAKVKIWKSQRAYLG